MPAGDENKKRRLIWTTKAKEKAKAIEEFRNKRDADVLNQQYQLVKQKTQQARRGPNNKEDKQDKPRVSNETQAQSSSTTAGATSSSSGSAGASSSNDGLRKDQQQQKNQNEPEETPSDTKESIDEQANSPEKPLVLPPSLSSKLRVLRQQIENQQQALGALPGLGPLMPPSPLDQLSNPNPNQTAQTNDSEIQTNDDNGDTNQHREQNQNITRSGQTSTGLIRYKRPSLTESQLKTKAKWNTHKRHEHKEYLTKMSVLLASIYVIMVCICGMAVISWYSMYRDAQKQNGENKGDKVVNDDDAYPTQSRPIHHAILF